MSETADLAGTDDATPVSATARSEATRARLLDAAVTAFSERGFHGTTTRDIAAAAGMSPAALYVHHRSKEELLHLISRAGHERSLAAVRAGLASSDDPVEQLRAVVHRFVELHARENTRSRVVNYELASLSEAHLAQMQEIRHETDRALRDLIEDGVARGVFDCPDPRVAGAALLSLGIDLSRWYREGGTWTPHEIAERYAELALRIVGARTG
jgi:AcrR family transcriptional regulator